MSIAYGELEEIIQHLIDDDSTETAAKILFTTNFHYRGIGEDHYWDSLKKQVSLATLLPGDAEKPWYVQPGDTDFLARQISETDRYRSNWLYNWFNDQPVSTPLVTGTDMVMTANSTTVTSAAPSTDFDATTTTLVGEFIKIGKNMGRYEIDSVTDANTLELTTGFRGASGTAQGYQVRPMGTRQLAITDEDGDAITSLTSWLFWYQQIPLPVYNEYDPILLPGNCEALVLRVHQNMLWADKYDNDELKKEPRYKAAIARMKPQDPTIGRLPRTRDRFGRPVQFGRRRDGKAYDANSRWRP